MGIAIPFFFHKGKSEIFTMCLLVFLSKTVLAEFAHALLIVLTKKCQKLQHLITFIQQQKLRN